jgi:hypothetical protein
MVHYRAHNGPPLVPLLSQMLPAHLISLRSILILPYHVRLGLPNGLFPTGFQTKILYAFFIYPIHATFPAYLTLHDLIILIMIFLQKQPVTHIVNKFHAFFFLNSQVHYHVHESPQKFRSIFTFKQMLN